MLGSTSGVLKGVGAELARPNSDVFSRWCPIRTSIPAAALAILIGFARIPADTFAPGPPSGRRVDPAPGLALPFPSQPVQGFSALVPDRGRPGWWLALPDNGYGTKANSDDFLLRVYRVRPRWSAGSVDVDPAFVPLADPDHRAGFPIVNDAAPGRELTGADFDPESLVVDRDGSLWIGEEFGPFVLHFSADGRLLSAPAEADGLRSPDYPTKVRLKPDPTDIPPISAGVAPTSAGTSPTSVETSPRSVGSGFSRTAEPTVRRSRGFEGLAARRDGRHLLALLEAGPVGDPPDTTRILEFDRRTGRFTGRLWHYRFDAADHSATEISPAVPATGCGGRCDVYLVIERDNLHGAAARFKKIFRVEIGAPDTFVTKALVVDLLDIANPKRVGGFPAAFRFPFITPESVWQTDARTLIVVNDNNYPETGGRVPGVRDDTEFIRLRIRYNQTVHAAHSDHQR